MRRILTFLFAALMSVGMWADPIVVTWDNPNLPDEGDSFSKDGVTLTCGDCFDMGEVLDGGTFTSTLGNFTRIEIYATNLGTGGNGWALDQDNEQMTWEGDAASVSFGGNMNGIEKIVFTIGPAAPAVPEWVRDGDEWDDASKTLTVKSNPGYQAYKYNTEIEHVIISSGVTSIGEQAFIGCTGLTSVTIPNSVTSIGGGSAFSYCSGLTSMVVASGNTNYDSRDNCNAIIETSSNTLIVGCENTIIPNSVTSIGNSAFRGRTGLTSVTIPNSVTSIGNSAFGACTALTSIEIPNGVTSIGGDAFNACEDLTSVTIPNSVTSIGERAFVGCTGLTSVTNYAVTPQTINNSFVFTGVNTSSCTLYVPEESISLYSAADVWKDFTIQAIPAYTVTANLADGAYWATFYNNAGNYQAPDGTQVFAVNLNTSTAEITMTEISDRIVKSGEGVVLKQETTSSDAATTITMTLTATAPAGDFSANSLLGTMTSITNPSYGSVYVLNGTNGAGFYKLSETGTIDANKAYLTYSGGGAKAREFFGFDEATGIEIPTVEDVNADAVVYDLQGRRVQNPTKGLYIVNGKKVFINK